MSCTKPPNPPKSDYPVYPSSESKKGRSSHYRISHFPKRSSQNANRISEDRSYLQTAEPYEPCTVLVLQGSDDGLTPHLGKGTTWCLSSRQRRLVSRPEGSKRRRMRTASSRGRGNWPRRRSIIIGRSSSLLEWKGKVLSWWG
jgi:hypothetical protein